MSTLLKIRRLVDSFENQISKKDYESFLKILSPFCPHITEELWKKTKFISLETWPKPNLKKINPELDAVDEFIENTMKDIHNIRKLVKIKPKKITISVADSWKYDLIKKIKKQMDKTRDISKIIKAAMTKQHAKDIAKMVPGFVKNPNKLPKTVLSQEKEFKALTQNKGMFKKEFSLEITIEKGSEKASPGKPAILFK